MNKLIEKQNSQFSILNYKMMKKILIIIISIILPLNIFAQDGYRINVKINHLKDSMLYLACHYGSGTLIKDSARLDNDGKLVFQGQEKLKGGIYFILFPNGRYFDFLIDKDTHFSISSDTSNFLMTVNFKGSKQNDMFYKYQQFVAQEYRVIAMFKEKQKSYITKLDSLMLMENKIQQRRNKIYLVKEDIIAKHSDSLLAALIKAELPIVPPPSPQDSSGNLLDSTFAYRYVKNHYFDNISFADARLIRAYALQNKVFSYLNRMVLHKVDSLNKEVDMIIDKAAANEEVYKFLLNSLLQYYHQSNIISDENVFVHIAEKYYLNGKAPWANKEILEKLKNDIENRKKTLIGAIAPEFSMKNVKGKTIKLRDIKSQYTILYFYDIDCDICKEVSPRLMNFYRIIKDRGVNILGIYIGKDKKRWVKYIENNDLQFINLWDNKNASGFKENYSINGVPKLFLLDKNQKIILKRVNVDQLMQYFNTVK